MRIGFYLAHPAHFHLFKNVIKKLAVNHEIIIAYNKKDVLSNLINSSELNVYSYEVKSPRAKGKISLLVQFFVKNLGAYFLFRKYKPDLVVGTPILISIIGKYIGYKSIIVNEDDFDIVWKTAKLGYPKADHILCPKVCRTLNFEPKSVKYDGYHELAYLHPNYFSANINIKKRYIPDNDKFFLMRFAKLSAHHDTGIKGIDDELALKIIRILEPYGKVYITSERKFNSELEPYRIHINPLEIHHIMAFASLYIGDSQTMAAEAGVLGIPFIRFNDFVGRISYLDELENVYKLGFGIKADNPEELILKTKELITEGNIKQIWEKRRMKMISEKIDVTLFFAWFIENYPKSASIMESDPDYQFNFK